MGRSSAGKNGAAGWCPQRCERWRFITIGIVTVYITKKNHEGGVICTNLANELGHHLVKTTVTWRFKMKFNGVNGVPIREIADVKIEKLILKMENMADCWKLRLEGCLVATNDGHDRLISVN